MAGHRVGEALPHGSSFEYTKLSLLQARVVDTGLLHMASMSTARDVSSRRLSC